MLQFKNGERIHLGCKKKIKKKYYFWPKKSCLKNKKNLFGESENSTFWCLQLGQWQGLLSRTLFCMKDPGARSVTQLPWPYHLQLGQIWYS